MEPSAPKALRAPAASWVEGLGGGEGGAGRPRAPMMALRWAGASSGFLSAGGGLLTSSAGGTGAGGTGDSGGKGGWGGRGGGGGMAGGSGGRAMPGRT